MVGPGIITTMFWLYMVNAVLLILHEIDSAYWKEWELFKMRGGITGFLLIHIPLLFAIIFGVTTIEKWPIVGIVFSFILSAGGLFAFTIHTIFIKKGREEFTTKISITILVATLLVSIAQVTVTILAVIYQMNI